ncbi:hypothetical protein [Pelagibacterium limicola]|uniref:hypothetical protein n=1 Tax=Pelagibacterium limicola TaxID=2791022 RepID=UPI0018AFE401|nr:hypothetical protein [Pelagibacterium limicola]
MAVAFAIFWITFLPAVGHESAVPGLIDIADVNWDAVPAGTPEAFEAAFGENTRTGNTRWYQAAREIDGETITFVPLALIPLPDGRTALVSTGGSSCTGQACSGVNSVHYLRREHARYEVDGEWLNVGATGTVGNPALRWGQTDAIADAPVLYTEGGGVWQGYACSYAALTHLTPAGPVEIASIPVYYSNEGAAEDGADVVTLNGHIVGAREGQSFTVRYSGTGSFNERYVRHADGSYHPVEPSRMPQCRDH